MSDIIGTNEQYCLNIELALDNQGTVAEEMVDGIPNESRLANEAAGNALILATQEKIMHEAAAKKSNITNKEDIMFNINKCNINVGGHQCRRNRTSGCTMEINGELIYTCRQHYTQYSTALVVNIPVYHFTNIKPVQEDTMNTNKTTAIHEEDYEVLDALDALHSTKAYCIEQMEGNQFTIYGMQTAGNIIIEVCTHEDFNLSTMEMIAEMRGEICCGKSNCQHYTYIQCLHHVPKITNQKENTMKTTKTIGCGYCHGHHNTIQEVAECGKVERTTTSSPNWDRRSFDTRKDAVAFQVSQKRGTVKLNDKTGKYDWFARKS